MLQLNQMKNHLLSLFLDPSLLASYRRINYLKLSIILLFFFGVYKILATGSFSYIIISLIFIILFNNVGMDAAIHRYLSHRSFQTNKFFNFILILFGVLSTVGNLCVLVGVHRLHHKHQDTMNDPQSYEYVSWWHLYTNNFPIIYSAKEWIAHTKDIRRDKLVSFFNNNYIKIILLYILILLLIDPMLFWAAYVIPAGFVLHTLGIVNIITHQIGYQNYKTAGKSKNSIFGAIISLGTNGWHNNHHNHPSRWTHGEKWWEIDPTAWVIRLIKY